MSQVWTHSHTHVSDVIANASAPAVQAVLSAVGRVMLAAIFVFSALGGKIPQFAAVAKMMDVEGIPQPRIMLALAIVFLLVGSVSVMLGWYARMGAGLLIVFLVLATYFFHDFWTFPAAEQQSQVTQFLKNTALAGAMLLIAANGAGAGSIDAAATRKAARQASSGPSIC